MGIPYKIEAALTPVDGPDEPLGIYDCYVQQRTGAGPRFLEFELGIDNPLAMGLGALATELYDLTKEKNPRLSRGDRDLFVDTFATMSVVKKRVVDNAVHRELAGHFPIVRTAELLPIQVTKQPAPRERGAANLGAAILMGEPHKPESKNVIYLPVPPGKYRIEYAVRSYPSKGTLSDLLIALHEAIPARENVEDLAREPAPTFLENVTLRSALNT